MMDFLNEFNAKMDKSITESKYKNLGHELSTRREEAGLKQVDIASATGMSTALITRLEANDLKDIKISTAVKLAEAYGISVNSFIEGLCFDIDVSEITKKIIKIKEARNTITISRSAGERNNEGGLIASFSVTKNRGNASLIDIDLGKEPKPFEITTILAPSNTSSLKPETLEKNAAKKKYK